MSSYVFENGVIYSDEDFATKRKWLEKAYADFLRLDTSKYHLDTKLGQARYALDCWFYREQYNIRVDGYIACMKNGMNEAQIESQLDIRVKMLVKLYNQKAEAMGIYPYNENKLTTIVS